MNAESDSAVWAQKDDPRITRVGKILRKTHIDEFPQFWNIFKGEMSVVGPRPERPEFIKELTEDIPFYRVRQAVKPGMAGWGLINQGYGASKQDSLEKQYAERCQHSSLIASLKLMGLAYFVNGFRVFNG